MTLDSVTAAYRAVLEPLAKARPSIAKDSRVVRFLANTPDRDDVLAMHKLLCGEFRGPCEDAGFDVDLLPLVSVAAVTFTFQSGSKASLTPDVFLVECAHTSPEVQALMDKVPGITEITRHKKWSVIAHPCVVPGLRSVAARWECEFLGDSLPVLKKLAQQDPTVATVSYGPRKTVDVTCVLTYPWLGEELKKRMDARWLAAEQCYRIPAAKVRALQQFLEESSLRVNVGDDLAGVWNAARQELSWDGTLASLADIPLSELRGITDAARKRLTAAGFTTAQQLLFMAPRRYVDRSMPQRIKDLREGMDAALLATVKSVRVMGQRKMVTYQVSDGSHTTTVTFFNALWMSKKFAQGDNVLIFGKVSAWGKGSPQMGFTNPMMEHFTDSTDRIFGIYPQSSKVSTEDIRAAIWELLDRLSDDQVDESGSLKSALVRLHRPSSLEEVNSGRERLAYEELLRLQLILAVEKHAEDAATGISNRVDNDAFARVISSLPYPLTGAQERAWKEISHDLDAPRSMHRLLQGDVGSGKTTVALLTLLAAVFNKKQAAVLAPTEILATQLYDTFAHEIRSMNLPFEVRVELFTNRLRGKTKEATYSALAAGDIHVAVGTHALLSQGVEFSDLSVVVVDEQHRFGVEQRAQLSSSRSDGLRPDTLVMTATPIPRTAALTVFGALDVSTLDELPPGRIPIATTWVNSKVSLSSSRAEAWKKVREQVKAGHQAYVVCPLVEESESLQVASAVETRDALSSGALEGLSLGLVHGQMKHDERHDVMTQFRNGDFDVLVATTVIEVGVNVPNASVIVVLDPQRFGMAQLHQLRGRVGRSSIPSSCFLYGNAVSEDAQRRLQALVDSTDGFVLSEIDLEIRGPGQMFGTAQSGISDLSIADLMRDADLLIQARDAAADMVSTWAGERLRGYLGHADLSEGALAWLKKS